MQEPIWAEIDLGAIRHNIKEVRRLVGPDREIMAVVKANGYGHGAVPVARAALSAGATRLAVARLNEAMVLRQAGINVPILVLGFIPPEQLAAALTNHITLTLYRTDLAEEISRVAQKLGQPAVIHLKVDTGMGRLGFIPEQGIEEVKRVSQLAGLKLEGIYTHFAAADETDKSYTRWQLDRFLSFISALEEQGVTFALRHCANSAAIIDHPEAYLDMVRPGIIIYGLYPSEEVNKSRVDLRPAMALKTRVAHLKTVKPGTKISYGCTYTVPRETVIGSLPLGYADGYPRLLSSRGQVIIRGQRAPIVGRVCMDQSMVDVGHIPGVKVGDEVLIFGRDGADYLPVEEVAAWLGTINYEMVCLVGARVPRIYKE
ncbi:alanine racemase [Desulfotomaculum nigrificans]|uniref:alanine racemase n=1 Tax=Desulfotomaculum nigrificans TaxID=1565 RepID=UPI0001FAE8B0|nr:alanine racemase [Desulfotomaculum nigrificans]